MIDVLLASIALVSTSCLETRAPAARESTALVLAGTTAVYGLEQPTTLALDRDGRFAWITSGEIPRSRGFDGDTAWGVEFADPPRALYLGEREEQIVVGLVLSGAWRGSDRVLVAAVPVAGEGTTQVPGADETFTFALRDGRASGSIRADASGRALRAEWTAGARASTLEIERWRELEGGTQAPTAFTLASDGDSVRVVIDGRARNATPSFEKPIDPPGRASFASETKVALEVKRAKTGHLLVQPSIDGRPAGWFIFDTGAGITVIDTQVAKDLALREVGGVPVAGLGGAVASPFVIPSTLTVGPLTLRASPMVAVDLSTIAKAMQEEIAGVIGYDVLARAVVAIDARAGTIEVRDPSRAGASEHAWSSMMLYRRRPCVPAKLEGRDVRLMLDTGSDGGVSIYAPAVAELALLDGRATTDGKVGGVGGFTAVKNGTVESLEIAGAKLTDVEAAFHVGAVGNTAETYYAGFVGGRVLANYRLVFDYANERVALEAH